MTRSGTHSSTRSTSGPLATMPRSASLALTADPSRPCPTTWTRENIVVFRRSGTRRRGGDRRRRRRQRHDGVAIDREAALEHLLNRCRRHGVDPRRTGEDLLRVAAVQLNRLHAAHPIAILLQRRLVVAPRGFLR